MLNVSGGCGHPPLHTGFRWPFRRGRCPHRPAAPAGAESPTSLCVGGGAKRRRERRADRVVRPYNRLPHLRLAFALSFHASDRVTGVGIRSPRTWRGSPLNANTTKYFAYKNNSLLSTADMLICNYKGVNKHVKMCILTKSPPYWKGGTPCVKRKPTPSPAWPACC